MNVKKRLLIRAHYFSLQVPAALVNFKWDPSVMRDIVAAQGLVNENVFLKPELLHLVQELS